MADEDDLGNFFDEINQIEETEAAEQPKQISIDQSSELQTSSKSVATERAIANGPTVVKQYGPQIVSKPAELVSKPAELVAVNRAIYTYGVSSNSTVEVSSTVARESSTENTEAEVSGSSNYQIKHASIGPSIGPVGPPTGPRPPSNSFPHSSSGGSNFSLHSFSTSYVTSTAPVAAPQMPKQDKTFVRTGAGEVWVDDTLKDWPENDYRIFVGDLGKETTTEMLAKIFQPYKSFAKAKVIRTKHEDKARGFGFVSFMDPMDCAKAIREMQGKYLGTRPMKITRSKWDELDIKQVKKKEQKKRKLQESLGL